MAHLSLSDHTPADPLKFQAVPGAWLGLMGGGQLGRMFVHAAQALGYRVLVLDPDAQGPAAVAADQAIPAAYDDGAAWQQLGERVSAVTTEFENVPAAALSALAAQCPVRPAASAVAVVQDRIAEKQFAQTHARVAPWAPIHSEDDGEALPDHLFPGLLKASRLGYDGKGQVVVERREDLAAAFAQLGLVPCVLEQRLQLQAEVSVVLARAADGEFAVFPVQQNVHRAGILALTVVPAQLDEAQQQAAIAMAKDLAQALDYVGVLCVEFFVLAGGHLVVNELAPRPHNSGHYSIDACACSQFEQQVRTLAGLPLGETTLLRPAAMLNLLGDVWFDEHGQVREPDWAGVLRIPGTHLHLYGKREARRGRKMGHITILAPDVATALHRAQAVEAVLGFDAEHSVAAGFAQQYLAQPFVA